MFKKNDTVFYTSGRDIIRAKVIVAHRDGSAKVQAQFYTREGRDQGVFIGYEYELDADYLYPNEMTADQAIIRMLTRTAESAARFNTASRRREDAQRWA